MSSRGLYTSPSAAWFSKGVPIGRHLRRILSTESSSNSETWPLRVLRVGDGKGRGKGDREEERRKHNSVRMDAGAISDGTLNRLE